TRYNASRIGELIDMMTLSDNLLAQMSSERIQTARIDGHKGKFTWHFEIKPATYSVNVIQYSQNAQPDQPKDGKNPNDASQSERLGFRIDRNIDEATKKWTGYRIMIVVHAPSGRKYAAETFRVGHKNTDEKQD